MVPPGKDTDEDMARRAAKMEVRKLEQDRENRVSFFDDMHHKAPHVGQPRGPQHQAIAWENDSKIEYRHKTPSSRWSEGRHLWAAEADPPQEVVAPGNAEGNDLPEGQALPTSRWCALHGAGTSSGATQMAQPAITDEG